VRSIVYNAAASNTPASLLDGVEASVCEVLGIASLRHRSALQELTSRAGLPNGAVAAAYAKVAANWRACQTLGVGRPSAENWRWRRPQLGISPQNTSPEVVLERALMAACERAGRTDWSNQVPVASGVAGAAAERRRAIDLVHQRGAGWFEFVELKVGSDTPLYAAIEILSYVAIWLVSRTAGGASDLLTAERISASVLAPEGYYQGCALGALQTQLNAEIAELGAEHGVQLDFAFEAFPDDLGRPPFTDAELLALLDGRTPL
jgi:hypothetical protein